MAEVTKAEILEQMCLLVKPRHTIRSAGQLSEAERKILTYKFIGGSSYFPISNTEKGEGIKRWLSDPFARVLIKSLSVDCETMEGILRKVLGDSYDSYYGIAKSKAQGKNAEVGEWKRAQEEAKIILKQGEINDPERLDWICSILDKAMFHPDSVYLSWNLKNLREKQTKRQRSKPQQ